MNQPSVWLEVGRDDFLKAIKALKPLRMPKAYLGKELQIGLLGGEAVFCIEGAQTRCAAKGDWEGFVCLSYGLVLPYLKVKPDGDPLRLSFEGGRLRIGSTRLTAVWISVSPWIGQMALEAHFMAERDNVALAATKRYCPSCGSLKGVLLADLPVKGRPTEVERQLQQLRDTTPATHACPVCRFAWIEPDAEGGWPELRQ